MVNEPQPARELRDIRLLAVSLLADGTYGLYGIVTAPAPQPQPKPGGHPRPRPWPRPHPNGGRN